MSISMQFTPNLDALNKKNALAEATAGKIPQRSAPKFGAKSCENSSFPLIVYPASYLCLDRGCPIDLVFASPNE